MSRSRLTVALLNFRVDLAVLVSPADEYSELSAGAELDVTWPLALPADLVPGSERARVEVAGDIMVPSISVRSRGTGHASFKAWRHYFQWNLLERQ